MFIYNDPTPINLSEYKQAIGKYIAQASKAPGLIAIYTMGSIKAPGLSDIDIIVVVDDNFNPQHSKSLTVKGVDSRVFIHGPVIIPLSMAKKLQYIIYATNLDLKYGKDCLQNFSELNKTEAHVLSLCFLIDYLESRQGQYVIALKKENLDKRAWLTRLWSLTHSVDLFCREIRKIDDEDQHVINRIKDIRYAWVNTGYIDDAEFIEIFYQSIITNKKLLLYALWFLYKNEQFDLHFSGNVSVANKIIKFDKNLSGCEYYCNIYKILGKDIPVLKVIWHPVFAIHLYNYNLIKYTPSTGKQKEEIKSTIMKQRSDLVKRHWKWLAHHCPETNVMSGYLGLKPSNFSSLRGIAEACIYLPLRLRAKYLV